MGSKLDVHGEEFIRVLVRRQLGLSCSVAALLVAALGAVLLMNRFQPSVMSTRLLGLPVSWWTVGVGAFPVLVGLAWVYLRRSGDFEDEAIGMVDIATLPPREANGSHPGKVR
jgi:putative solute:sodium symporter small subunit